VTARSHRQTIAAAIATLAAAVSLNPLFIGSTWFWAGAGATVTVAVAGTLTRLRRLPLLACLTVGLLVLVCYLNLVFEAGHSFGHVLPTLNSLERLGRLARAGVDESGKYAPPAPELPGIVLLGTGGIGIVALLVDFTAVRLRRAALAGAPLLLLVTEPFAVSAARGWFETVGAFCLGTVGYLAMLSVESRERIREWEQPRSGPGDGPDMSALASAGRRVGAAAVVIAVCLPVLIPGLHVTRLLGGQPGIGGNPGDGYSADGAGFPSPEVAMSTQLQEGANTPVLRYGAVVTSAGTPVSPGKSAPEYLQLYVLDQFTAAEGFQVASGSAAVPLSNAGPTLPAAPGLPGNPLVTGTHSAWPLVSTSIRIDPGVAADTSLNGQTAAVLPVPYPALSVTVPTGTWQVRPGDLMVYSTNTQVSGLSYGVISLDPTPTNQAMEDAGPPPSSIVKDYRSVPSSYEGLTTLAQNITTGDLTAIDKARAIQAWLDSGAFTYTLKAPQIDSAAGLETFLQSTKRGYCQQFAFSMAVLARLVGIPSRVVVGYTSGTQQKDGSWLVRTHDAHEWPELYFAGSGWLRFEPTPSGADGAGTATEPAYTQEPTSTGNPGSTDISPVGSVPSATPSAAKLPPGSRLGLPPIGEGGLGGTFPGKAGGLTPWQIFGLVMAGLLAAAVIAPSAARLAIRRQRWGRARRGGDAALAHAAWRELQDDLVDYRAGFAPSESPRATGTRLGTQRQLSGASFEALARITLAEERAQYAASPVPGRHLRADSTRVRRALAATTSRAGRLRARVLPPSVLRYPRR
jgi:transglutaminase-like putative cysteine protease